MKHDFGKLKTPMVRGKSLFRLYVGRPAIRTVFGSAFDSSIHAIKSTVKLSGF